MNDCVRRPKQTKAEQEKDNRDPQKEKRRK
jgi:hypothetical protein